MICYCDEASASQYRPDLYRGPKVTVVNNTGKTLLLIYATQCDVLYPPEALCYDQLNGIGCACKRELLGDGNEDSYAFHIGMPVGRIFYTTKLMNPPARDFFTMLVYEGDRVVLTREDIQI